MENQKEQSGSLAGKKVVVLGGSAGIGLATAIAAANAGAHIVIASSNKQRINLALQRLPQGCEGYAVDFKNENAIKTFFEATGNFDHLVFTAGESLVLGNLSTLDIAEAHRFFELRYWGAVTAAKYAAPFISKDGSIVLTSGIAGLRPNAGWALGASICAAMEGLNRALAVEFAPVRVNIVSPGFVRTELWSNIPELEREALFNQVGSALPVKRVGEATDIAKAYLYLMTQQFCTGQALIVDGGGVLV